jgi:hypothetical protein
MSRVAGYTHVMRPELGTSLDARGIRQKASKMLRRLVKFVEEDTSGQLGGLLAIVALGALVWLFREFLL